MWEKIVLNLLSNAFKFTFAGTIRVSLAWRGASVELAVATPASAFAPTSCRDVFERFHRVERTRARTHEGSGIGLALVHELVALHGGTVACRQRARTQGTTFTVSLPHRRRASAHENASAPRDPRSRRAIGRRAVRRGGAALAADAHRRCRARDHGPLSAATSIERASWSPTTTPTCATTSRRLLATRWWIEAVGRRRGRPRTRPCSRARTWSSPT